MTELLPALSLAAVPGRRARTLELATEIERRGFGGKWLFLIDRRRHGTGPPGPLFLLSGLLCHLYSSAVQMSQKSSLTSLPCDVPRMLMPDRDDPIAVFLWATFNLATVPARPVDLAGAHLY